MSDRFDAKAAWGSLSPDEQRDIGEAGLLLAYAIDAKEWFGDAAAPAFEAAESEAYDILLGAARAAEIPEFAAEPPAVPDLAPFDIVQCRRCGCTDRHACPQGCSWTAPGLCSVCAAKVN